MIPLRSQIKHPHAFPTDSGGISGGADFSKTVVIVDGQKYIDSSTIPFVEPMQRRGLQGKDYIVEQKLFRYIQTYKKALQNQNVPRNKILVQNSALQYFHKELGITRLIASSLSN